MRKVNLFILFLLLGGLSYAQVCVSGRVYDAGDGHALEYVHVGVVDGALRPAGSVTDAAGRYHICFDAVADSVVLRFSSTGYTSRSVVLAVASRRDTLHCDMRLSPAATNLQEVTVVGETQGNTGFTVISAAALTDVAGPASGVETLVKTLPDVASNNELSSQYSVRGGSFDENLVYLNGVEVFRPMLVRSGQQEGMSIINADMVDHLFFSPGGFDARYGDKMSSVLDVVYGQPTRFGAKLSASLLGATAHLEGPLGSRWSYNIGFRHHTNNYILSSLDTKGSYNTAYSDLQMLLTGRLGERWRMQLLTIVSRNRYGLVPESQTTSFGSFLESLELDVYFDGKETDAYGTLLSAVTFSYQPSETSQIDYTLSAQQVDESENYDIQSQYWLYEVGVGAGSETQRFDRGVGTFLEHARNRLATTIVTNSVRGTHVDSHGSWLWGLSLQSERVTDHLREWRWVDSAGYAMPTGVTGPGYDTVAYSPILQSFVRADNSVSTVRLSAFAQRELDWSTSHGHQWRLQTGFRVSSYWQRVTVSDNDPEHVSGPLLLSPRLSLGVKPNWERRDMFFRLSLGIYQQPPFYRESRRPDGSLNSDIRPQQSYQATATFDYSFQLWERPFKLTTDLYYKYITHLIPYTVDNLRVTYMAHNDAVGYATGLSLRVNGQWVDDLESWASLSIMQTQEDIEGDGLGWLARPTDQRLSFKLFFQDNLPSSPWWRMSMGFVFGTGMPVVFAHQANRSTTHRLPNYFRVDWNNSVRLSQLAFYPHSCLRHFREVLIGFEVYNLFNHRNVASYIWVSDYEGTYYAVPNYLTARQFNIKLTLEL